MINYQQFLEIDPNKRFGQPVIKGMRISVYDVLSWFAEGMTEADILADFPELKQEHIRACFAYAADKTHKVVAA